MHEGHFTLCETINHACEAKMFCLCKRPLHKQQLQWTSCVNCWDWVNIVVDFGQFGPHNASTASNTKYQVTFVKNKLNSDSSWQPEVDVRPYQNKCGIWAVLPSGVSVNGRKSVSAGRRDVQLTEYNSTPLWLPWFHRLEWNGWKMIFPWISEPPNTKPSFSSGINISTI